MKDSVQYLNPNSDLLQHIIYIQTDWDQTLTTALVLLWMSMGNNLELVETSNEELSEHSVLMHT
jgi:hypothetical protein